MFQYRVCNSEECPGPYEDFRAQQCAKRNSYYIHQNAKHSWVPHEPDDGEWALFSSHPRVLEHLLGPSLARQGLPGLGPTVKVEGQWGRQKGRCSQQACRLRLCRPSCCVCLGKATVLLVIPDLPTYNNCFLEGQGRCLEQGRLPWGCRGAGSCAGCWSWCLLHLPHLYSAGAGFAKPMS